ncbi:MAG: hypothetical protein JSR66_23185 [Proteobacteria bacterium]|nr:hypothetical protein [Pseudomonadota bacterium]
MLPNFKVWLNHFEYHAEHPRRLPEAVPNVLTVTERHLIAPSIATFQLGEQSSGSNLLRAAYRFAQQHSAPEVARITELLIGEEQQHAALLKGFMAAHGIPTRQHHWTDRAFRRIRKRAELELSLGVLLTAELIGNVYYRALEMATECQRLRLLCRMMVADELAHIGFESDLLLSIRAGKPAPVKFALDGAHRAFLMATALVVWTTHRAVLAKAGYGLAGFLRACGEQYRFYLLPPVRPYQPVR